MRFLNTAFIVLAVICVPTAFYLILARSNPNLLEWMPTALSDTLVQYDWIGFVVCGLGVIATLSQQWTSSVLKRGAAQ